MLCPLRVTMLSHAVSISSCLMWTLSRPPLTAALFSGHQMFFELFHSDVPKAPTLFKTNFALSLSN